MSHLPNSLIITGSTNGHPPASSTGDEGSYFLDLDTSSLFGPRTSDVWPPVPVIVIGGGFVTGGRILVSAGTTPAPGIGIGTTGTGLAQTTTNVLSLIPGGQDYTQPDQHSVSITKRGIAFGGVTAGGDTVLPNQSVIEIKYTNNGNSSVPYTAAEWNSAGSACEPHVFYRSRGTNIGDSGVVLAGDSIFNLQPQVDNGTGLGNIALGNIGVRVQSGTTPITAGTTTQQLRGYCGQLLVGLTPGDGVTAVTSRFSVRGNGDVDIYSGGLIFGTVNTVISSTRVGTFSAIAPNKRSGIADQAIYQLPIPGGTTAIVTYGCSALSDGTYPFGSFAVRVDSKKIDQISLNALAVTAAKVAYATSATAPTDPTVYTSGSLTFVACDDLNVYVVNRLGGSRTMSFTIQPMPSTGY